MAIYLGMSSLIIKREAIEKKYSGGWEVFLIDECMRRNQVEFDKYLFRENSMGYHSTYPYFTGLVDDNLQEPYWDDYVILGYHIEKGKCDWLTIEEYKKDEVLYHCAFMKGKEDEDTISSETGLKETYFENSLTLGLKYLKGDGVTKNFETARKLLKNYTDMSGQPDAEIYLGKAYKKGDGVEANFVKAHLHFCVAETCESIEAKNLRIEIEKKLDEQLILKNYRQIRQLLKSRTGLDENTGFDEITGLTRPSLDDLKKSDWLSVFFSK